MNKTFITVLMLILSVFSTMYGQKTHKLGLLSEDISKNTRIKKAEAPSLLLHKFPSSVDNSAHLPPVGDQGIQSCCVAWAFGYYYKTYQEWQDNGWTVTDSNHIFSPAFIYHNINGGQDSGSYFSDAFLLLAEMGCATIAQFPYNDSNYTSWPSESVYRNAINYRSGDTLWYYQTTGPGGINSVKQLLAQGNIAVFGIQVYENFELLDSVNDTYCVRNSAGSSLGGHAVTFVGYDDNKITLDGMGAFKMINQWGTDWGNKGYFWMSYQAVMNSYLSEGAAYFTTDRGKYSPSLIASAQITHPNVNLLNLGLGIGSTSSTVSVNFFNFYMNSLPHPARPFPSNSIDFDLTDVLSYYNTGKFNTVYLSAQSTVPGTVNNFSFTDLRISNTTTSTQTPKTITGNNKIVYTDIALSPAVVVPASPLNNSTGVTQPVTLKWISSSGAVSYRLQLGKDSTFSTTICDTTGLIDTSLTISGLSNLTKYYWRVNAKNTVGTNNWSTIWNFTTLTVTPSSPVLLAPVNNAVGQAVALKLNWNASTGTNSYKIQVSTSSTFSTLIVNDSLITTTSLQVTGLANNTIYYWRVNAKNTNGTSSWSPVWNFTTLISLPAVPVLLSPANNAVNQAAALKLSWNASTVANSYNIQLSTTPAFSTLILNDSLITTTSLQVTGLANNTTYYWRVNAKNISGTSNWSSAWNFTTLIAVPTVPVPVSPVNNAVNQAAILKFNWNASTGAGSYKIQLSTTSAFTTLLVNDSVITTTSLQVAGLANGTKYYWRVNAKNTSGTSPWSTVMDFTTIAAATKFVSSLSTVNHSDLIQYGGAADILSYVPAEYKLFQNYPNPFNPATTINYSIPKSGLVTIKIYNVLGKEIETLINEEKSAGNYSLVFSAGNLPSGIYFYQMQSGNFSQIKKLIILK
jgi:hypothetical protein